MKTKLPSMTSFAAVAAGCLLATGCYTTPSNEIAYYDYDYYPGPQIYYYPAGGIYYWRVENRWHHGRDLPHHYDLHGEHHQPIHSPNREPWRAHPSPAPMNPRPAPHPDFHDDHRGRDR